MKHEVIIAGFGGQGVMVMGQLLAYAAMAEGKHVSWMPSYGPEMRGGTANCAVIISDEPVGDPMVSEPTAAIMMNSPSLDKFWRGVKTGGDLIINGSLIEKEVERSDIHKYRVPINQIAVGLGSEKMINMVALGALLAAVKIVSPYSLLSCFAKKFAAKPAILASNTAAFQQGYACVAKHTP
jgi:2-oxoglutarate ferredoxin oxidoreductase subunit gamma